MLIHTTHGARGGGDDDNFELPMTTTKSQEFQVGDEFGKNQRKHRE